MSDPKDLTDWMWRLRADGKNVRLELYTVPGWSERLAYRLRRTYGLRGVRIHGTGTVRVKGAASVEAALRLVTDDSDIIALAGAYRACCRTVAIKGIRKDQAGLVRRLLKEDENRWPI